MRASWLVFVIAACHRAATPSPGTPDDLAAYLATVAGGDEPARLAEVRGWILDQPLFGRTVVDPYRALWADYVHAADAAAPTLARQLATAGPITARKHFAGDPRLTLAQARTRWALPVMYPSAVAELAGQPIDCVFVHDGAHWRALFGLDELVLARVRALDPACGALLARAGPTGRCTEVGFAVADAALRDQRDRFAHACGLAAALCGTASP